MWLPSREAGWDWGRKSERAYPVLTKLTELALVQRVFVLLLSVFLVAGGVMAFRGLPIDAFPDVTPAQVNIYTESPGLAAEDVEKLLTTPIEGAMAGLAGVEEVRSVSLFGLSYVGVYFKDNVDIYFDGPASETEIDAQVNMVKNELAKNPKAMALAALSKSATPRRVRENAVVDHPVVLPAVKKTQLK